MLWCILVYKFINPKGGYGIPRPIAASENGRESDTHKIYPIEPFFTNYGGVL